MYKNVRGKKPIVKEYIRDRRSSLLIGDDRVLRLARDYENKGFLVFANSKNHEGPDLIVISVPEGRVVKVIESTNYERPEEYIAAKTFSRYIDSLCYFKGIEDVELELVVSFFENVSNAQYLELQEHDIKLVIENHQDGPFEGRIALESSDGDIECWIE